MSLWDLEYFMEMPFCYGKRLSNSLWKSFAHDWLVLLCSWNIFRDRMKNLRSIIMAKWNFCVILCWFETCIFPCLVILKKTCLGYKSIMHRDISEFDFISSVFSGFKSCISDMIKTHSLFRMSLPTIEVIQFLGNRFFLPVSSNMFFASTRVTVPKLLWMFFLFRFFFFGGRDGDAGCLCSLCSDFLSYLPDSPDWPYPEALLSHQILDITMGMWPLVWAIW